MITPAAGVAFTLAADGDVRNDSDARASLSRRLGVADQWATVHQVHGHTVVEAASSGDLGEADAIYTTQHDLPIAVYTADCLGVVVVADGGVGVAHAGWRGMDRRVIARLIDVMNQAGLRPQSAYLGPAIGPCCFEVGPEVAGRFTAETAETTWGTTSVDLIAAARSQLVGLQIWESGRCTMHQPEHHSHRSDGTRARMAAIPWRTSGG